MRRGFNVRWFLKFLGIAALVVVLVHAIHHFQVWRNARTFLEYADDAVAKEKLRQATDYLEQYLVLRPDDWDAAEKYADLLDKQGMNDFEFDRVVTLREKLLRVFPDRHATRLRLAKQYDEGGQRADARQHYVTLLGAKYGKEDELRQKLAENYAADNKHKQAEEQFQLAVKANPQRVSAWLAMADHLQHSLVRAEDAQQALNDMIAANPQSAAAYLGRSQFNTQLHPEQADKDLDEAIRLAPNDPEVVVVAAERAQHKDLFDSARAMLVKAQAEHPENVAVAKAMWALELRKGRRAEAQAALEKGLEKNANNIDLRLLLADLLIDQGKPETARPIVDGLKKSDIAPGLSEFLDARILVLDKKYQEALKLLEKARTDLEGKSDWIVRVWGLIGYCDEKLGDLSGQLRAYAEAIRLDPNWTAARFGLGNAYVLAGRPDEAILELTRVAAAPDASSAAPLVLARALLQRNATLREAERDWTLFDETFAKATKADARGIDSAELKAQALALRKQPDEALKTLDAIQASYPDDAGLWTLRAEIEETRTGIAKAFSVLDDAVKKAGDRIEFRQARTRLIATHPTESDPQLLHEIARRLDAFDDDAKCRLYRDLAEAWLRLGDRGQSEHYWRLVAQKQPRDLSSRLRLFEIALAENRPDSAKTWIDELRRVEGQDGAMWRIANAGLAIQNAGEDAKRLDDIRADLQRLQKGHADWSLVPVLLARIDEKQTKQEDAIGHYAKAVELGDRTSAVLGRLAKLLAERDRYQDAEQALRRLEQKGPLGRDLAKLGIEVALAIDNRARVVALLGQAADPQSRDYRDLVWRGGIQASLKNDELAEREYRRAVEVAPHAPETWAALVGFLSKHGKAKQTPEVLESMKAKVAKNQLDVALARCAIATGEYAEANRRMQECIQAKPNDFLRLALAADFYRRFERSEEAAGLYRKLLEPKSGAPAEIVAEATRSLASLALPNAEAGLKLLDQATFREVRDQRLRWYLEGQNAAKRKDAITRFEASFASAAPTVEERRMLAKLYEADGRKDQARDVLQKTAAFHSESALLADYIRMLLATDGMVEAEAQLARLERLESNSPRLVELREKLKTANK
ncbi:MAG: tetratricopeptide repeat protein [Gemmataceae bacterium]